MQSNKERIEYLWENELKDNKILKDFEELLKVNNLTLDDLKKIKQSNFGKDSVKKPTTKKRYDSTRRNKQDKEQPIIVDGATKVFVHKNTATEITSQEVNKAEPTNKGFKTMVRKTGRTLKQKNNELIARNREMSEINAFVRKWKNLMVHLGLYNKIYKTYTFTELNFEKYGVIAEVVCVTGLTLSKLEDNLDQIESEFDCCVSFIKRSDSKRKCKIKFIKPNLSYNQIPFEPYKVKPYELYFGVDETGMAIIADRTQNPHTLIAGQTGRGKNGALDHALISSIVYCDPEDLQLILLEGYKSDLAKYSLAPHTQAYVRDFEDMQKIMVYIENEMRRRIKLFVPMLIKIEGDNLKDFHKYLKDNGSKDYGPLPYILVVVDEFLGLMPSGNGDSKNSPIEKAKTYIRNVLQSMAQIGRSVGIHYVISHQKPEKELMPTFLKNMTSTRVCFGFSDAVCSEIVLGSKAAHLLPPRRAIFLSDNGDESLFYTTDLRQKSSSYILENRVKKYRTDTIQAKILGEDSLYKILGPKIIKEIDSAYVEKQFLKKYDTTLLESKESNPPKNSEERADLQNKGIISDRIDYSNLFE